MKSQNVLTSCNKRVFSSIPVNFQKQNKILLLGTPVIGLSSLVFGNAPCAFGHVRPWRKTLKVGNKLQILATSYNNSGSNFGGSSTLCVRGTLVALSPNLTGGSTFSTKQKLRPTGPAYRPSSCAAYPLRYVIPSRRTFPCAPQHQGAPTKSEILSLAPKAQGPHILTVSPLLRRDNQPVGFLPGTGATHGVSAFLPLAGATQGEAPHASHPPIAQEALRNAALHKRCTREQQNSHQEAVKPKALSSYNSILKTEKNFNSDKYNNTSRNLWQRRPRGAEGLWMKGLPVKRKLEPMLLNINSSLNHTLFDSKIVKTPRNGCAVRGVAVSYARGEVGRSSRDSFAFPHYVQHDFSVVRLRVVATHDKGTLSFARNTKASLFLPQVLIAKHNSMTKSCIATRSTAKPKNWPLVWKDQGAIPKIFVKYVGTFWTWFMWSQQISDLSLHNFCVNFFLVMPKLMERNTPKTYQSANETVTAFSELYYKNSNFTPFLNSTGLHAFGLGTSSSAKSFSRLQRATPLLVCLRPLNSKIYSSSLSFNRGLRPCFAIEPTREFYNLDQTGLSFLNSYKKLYGFKAIQSLKTVLVPPILTNMVVFGLYKLQKQSNKYKEPIRNICKYLVLYVVGSVCWFYYTRYSIKIEKTCDKQRWDLAQEMVFKNLPLFQNSGLFFTKEAIVLCEEKKPMHWGEASHAKVVKYSLDARGVMQGETVREKHSSVQGSASTQGDAGSYVTQEAQSPCYGGGTHAKQPEGVPQVQPYSLTVAPRTEAELSRESDTALRVASHEAGSAQPCAALGALSITGEHGLGVRLEPKSFGHKTKGQGLQNEYVFLQKKRNLPSFLLNTSYMSNAIGHFSQDKIAQNYITHIPINKGYHIRDDFRIKQEVAQTGNLVFFARKPLFFKDQRNFSLNTQMLSQKEQYLCSGTALIMGSEFDFLPRKIESTGFFKQSKTQMGMLPTGLKRPLNSFEKCDVNFLVEMAQTEKPKIYNVFSDLTFHSIKQAELEQNFGFGLVLHQKQPNNFKETQNYPTYTNCFPSAKPGPAVLFGADIAQPDRTEKGLQTSLVLLHSMESPPYTVLRSTRGSSHNQEAQGGLKVKTAQKKDYSKILKSSFFASQDHPLNSNNFINKTGIKQKHFSRTLIMVPCDRGSKGTGYGSKASSYGMRGETVMEKASQTRDFKNNKVLSNKNLFNISFRARLQSGFNFPDIFLLNTPFKSLLPYKEGGADIVQQDLASPLTQDFVVLPSALSAPAGAEGSTLVLRKASPWKEVFQALASHAMQHGLLHATHQHLVQQMLRNTTLPNIVSAREHTICSSSRVKVRNHGSGFLPQGSTAKALKIQKNFQVNQEKLSLPTFFKVDTKQSDISYPHTKGLKTLTNFAGHAAGVMQGETVREKHNSGVLPKGSNCASAHGPNGFLWEVKPLGRSISHSQQPESFFGTSYLHLGERFTIEKIKSKNQIGFLYSVHNGYRVGPLVKKTLPFISTGTSLNTIFGKKILKQQPSKKAFKTQSPFTNARAVSQLRIIDFTKSGGLSSASKEQSNAVRSGESLPWGALHESAAQYSLRDSSALAQHDFSILRSKGKSTQDTDKKIINNHFIKIKQKNTENLDYLLSFKRISGNVNRHLINPFKYYNPGTKRDRNIEDAMLTLEGYKKSRLFPTTHINYEGIASQCSPDDRITLWTKPFTLKKNQGQYQNTATNRDLDLQSILGGMRQKNEAQRITEKTIGPLYANSELQKNSSLTIQEELEEQAQQNRIQKKAPRNTNYYPLRTLLTAVGQRGENTGPKNLRAANLIEYNVSNIDNRYLRKTFLSWWRWWSCVAKGTKEQKVLDPQCVQEASPASPPTLGLQSMDSKTQSDYDAVLLGPGFAKHACEARGDKVMYSKSEPVTDYRPLGKHFAQQLNGSPAEVEFFKNLQLGRICHSEERNAQSLQETTVRKAPESGKQKNVVQGSNKTKGFYFEKIFATPLLCSARSGEQTFKFMGNTENEDGLSLSLWTQKGRTIGLKDLVVNKKLKCIGSQANSFAQVHVWGSLSKILFFSVIWSSYKILATPLIVSNFLPATFTEAIGLQSFQKKYRIITRGNTKVNFKNLAGIEKTLSELRNLIWIFRLVGTGGPYGEYSNLTRLPYFGHSFGQQRSSVFSKTRNRFLLVGPPGTGKTLLVKALAAEANVPVIVQPVSQLHMIGGVENPVSALFHVARQIKPCIIFLDELDTLGTDINKSEKLSGKGTTEEKIDTKLAQKYTYTLLLELDGLISSTRDLLIIGATNRPETLNPALTRAGRFETVINCNLPSQEQRFSLFSLYLPQRQKHSSTVISNPFLGGVLPREQKMLERRLCYAKKRNQKYIKTGSYLDYVIKASYGLSQASIETAINQSALNSILQGNRCHTYTTLEQAFSAVRALTSKTTMAKAFDFSWSFSCIATQSLENMFPAKQKNLAQNLSIPKDLDPKADFGFLGELSKKSRRKLCEKTLQFLVCTAYKTTGPSLFSPKTSFYSQKFVNNKTSDLLKKKGFAVYKSRRKCVEQGFELALFQNYAGHACLILYNSIRPQSVQFSHTLGLYQNPVQLGTTLFLLKNLEDRQLPIFRPVSFLGVKNDTEVGAVQNLLLSTNKKQQNKYWCQNIKKNNARGKSIHIHQTNSVQKTSYSFVKELSRQIRRSSPFKTGWFRIYLSRPIFRYDSESYIENKEYYPKNNYSVYSEKRLQGSREATCSLVMRRVPRDGAAQTSHNTTLSSSLAKHSTALNAWYATQEAKRHLKAQPYYVPRPVNFLNVATLSHQTTLKPPKDSKGAKSSSSEMLSVQSSSARGCSATPGDLNKHTIPQLYETYGKNYRENNSIPQKFSIYLAISALIFHNTLLFMQKNRELADYCVYKTLRYGGLYEFYRKQACEKFI